MNTRCQIHRCTRRARLAPVLQVTSKDGTVKDTFVVDLRACLQCAPQITAESIIGPDTSRVEAQFVDKHNLTIDWETAGLVWGTIPRRKKRRRVAVVKG